MAQNNIDEMHVVPVLNTIEENYAPEGMEKNDAQCQCCTRYEEKIGAAFQAHRAGSNCISQNIDALKELKHIT
jgi:hypothetical protein